MKAFVIALALSSSVFLTGCTFNVSMAHTEGKAVDVIDDNAEASPDVAPNVNISGVPAL